MFARGDDVESVATATGRSLSTAWLYLFQFVEANPTQSLDRWIDPSTYDTVLNAAKEVGTAYLRPIHEKLEGKVSFEHIRLALARIRSNPST